MGEPSASAKRAAVAATVTTSPQIASERQVQVVVHDDSAALDEPGDDESCGNGGGEVHGEGSQLLRWNPEDTTFWHVYGRSIARTNLWVSIPNLLLMFATWLMWSMIIVQIQDAHTEDKNAFAFTEWLGENAEDDEQAGRKYKATLLLLPAVAGLSGATLRIPNSFMTSITGGRMHNAANSGFPVITFLLLGILAKGNCTFLTLLVLCSFSGFGGGAFASSMNNISCFFPKAEQGVALGLNAGLGNCGVSVAQLLVPAVSSIALFGGEAYGGKWTSNCGYTFAILLAVASIAAWFYMNSMPDHGAKSTRNNFMAYIRLEGIGFLGVFVAVAMFVGSNELVKASPALQIVRIFIVSIAACLVTLAGMRFLVPGDLKNMLLEQASIFKNKHTWYMTYLYVMTFGSFIGYSAAFPKLIKDYFGYLPNGDPNPNAISAAAYAWLGPFLGSISRPVGGWLADKYGGAAVTHWGTVIEVLSTVFAGIAIAKIQVSDTPEIYFPAFFLCFMLLFLSTGISNGSTFRQISVIFNKEQTGPVLGWTSAVAAYGAALFPALFSAGYAGKFVPEMMYFLAAYYASCLLLNYWMYYRSNAEIHC